MTEHDSRRILDWLDSALELFHIHEGHLTAKEVRILSMLAVARRELADDLADPKKASRPQS